MTEIVNGPNRIRRMENLRAGQVIPTHYHDFGHTFYVPRGSARVEILRDDGSTQEQTDLSAASGKNFVYIDAFKTHRITALEDGTNGDCIFASRFPRALSERRGQHPEFDALLIPLMELANELFGDISEYDTGWPGASAGNHG